MKNNHQQGSVVAFILAGVVLLGLLAGGVYLAKHQARLARSSDAQPATLSTQNDKQQGSEEDKKPDEQKPAPEPQAPANEQNQPTADGERNSAPQNNESPARERESVAGARNESVPATGPAQIAATGPEQYVASILALGITTVAFVAYLNSHRHLLGLRK